MPSILVSGPVRGNYTSLFKAVAKAQKKGEFAAALCVGNFLGETRDAPAESAPLPVYVVTGEDAIDADLASRLAAKNIRWLGRSGCEDVAGLRVRHNLGYRVGHLAGFVGQPEVDLIVVVRVVEERGLSPGNDVDRLHAIRSQLRGEPHHRSAAVGEAGWV